MKIKTSELIILNIICERLLILKVSVCTLGCKVNKYESDVLLEKFVTKGYEIAAFGEKSDVVIIQTCCVTEES